MSNANQKDWGMDPVSTGARIRKMRRDSGYKTLDSLLDALFMKGIEISKNSASSWETGKKRPTVDHLIALCDVFGCRLDELVVRRERSRDADDRDQLVPLENQMSKVRQTCTVVCVCFFIVMKDARNNLRP